MSKENNIDKLFRDNLSNNSYSFNEKAWENMESLLNEQEATAGSASWRQTSSILSLLLISLFSWVSLNPGSSDKYSPRNGVQTASISPFFNSAQLYSSDESLDNPPVSSTVTRKQSNDGVSEKTSSVSYVTQNSSSEVSEPLAMNANNQSSQQPDDTPIDQLTPHQAFFSLSAPLLNPTPIDPVSGKHIVNYRHGLSVELSNTVSNGFGDKSGLFGASILNGIALNYTYSLGSAISLSSGLAYRSKGGQGYSRDFENTHFSFGKTTSNTSIVASSMHYLELPLLLNYQLKPRHGVFVGAQLSYLLNVRNKVLINDVESSGYSEQSSDYQWGMVEDFNPMDVAVRFGYDYTLSQKFSVGLNGQIGLLDFTRSGSNKYHRELQFTLKYKLSQF